jgi:hypothetical protein
MLTRCRALLACLVFSATIGCIETSSLTTYPDEGERSFVEGFAGLSRLDAPGTTVLYEPRIARVVDSLRSSYPVSHPLYEDSESGMDDRVLLRLRLPTVPDVEYVLVHTDGMSGDPGFYLLSEQEPEQQYVELGEIIAVPQSGDIQIYQRTNSSFAKRRTLHVVNHSLTEIKPESYTINLRTVTIDSVWLQRSDVDTTLIGLILPGYLIDVLDSAEERRDGRMLYRVRNERGRVAWAWLLDSQCPTAQVRGICFVVD